MPIDTSAVPEAELPDEEKLLAEQKRKGQTFLSMIKEREHEFDSGWWKAAKDAVKLYGMPIKENETLPQDVAYNILYSNTEVLLPSLYSAQAKPDVRPRFKGSDIKPIPEVIERFLTIATDGTQPGFESFDDAVKNSVLSSLTAGSGVIRLRYYEDQEFPIQFESVPYRDFLYGKGKKWAKVPWVAFKYELSKSDFFKQMGIEQDEEGIADRKFSAVEEGSDKEASCCLYEFWHKASGEVWFLCDEWDDKVPKKVPDPLGLKGFFPVPGLLQMTLKPDSLEPTPLYTYYKNQAEELNRVTVRLNKVLSAIRVRGVYSTLLGDDLQKILSDTEMENALLPASDSALLAQAGGFEKMIWLLPIEKLITVAQQLYLARESIKNVIYELTGLSDIIRGSSVASETATAQDLKNKWGTVRLRKMQTLVANYIRDLFRMAVDCGSSRVPPETWQKLVQMNIPLQQEKMLAQQQLQHTQEMQQTAAMQAQATGQQPPPPQPPDPKLLHAAQSPSMEEVLAKISSDIDRTFTVNIQTSSTVDLDTAADKAEVSEFMNAMGQLLAGLQPLASLGSTGLEASKAILVAVCQRFKFGLQIVDSIMGIQPPDPNAGKEKPNPEEEKAATAEFQVKQQISQMKLQEAQAAHEVAMQKAANEKLSAQVEQQKLQNEIELLPLRAAAEREKLLSKPRSLQNAPVRS